MIIKLFTIEGIEGSMSTISYDEVIKRYENANYSFFPLSLASLYINSNGEILGDYDSGEDGESVIFCGNDHCKIRLSFQEETWLDIDSLSITEGVKQ